MSRNVEGAAESWHIYLVRCRNGALYTGIALDVAKRFAQHEASGGTRGAKFLRGKGPLQLAFTAEVGDRPRALRVEHRVRRLAKARKEALVSGAVSIADLYSE